MTRRTARQAIGAMKEVATLRFRGVPFPPVAPDLGKTGVFIGRLDERRFRGHWESFDPPKRLPFDLRVVRRRAP